MKRILLIIVLLFSVATAQTRYSWPLSVESSSGRPLNAQTVAIFDTTGTLYKNLVYETGSPGRYYSTTAIANGVYTLKLYSGGVWRTVPGHERINIEIYGLDQLRAIVSDSLAALSADGESLTNSGGIFRFIDAYFADLSRKEASTALVTEYGAVPDDGSSDVTAIQNAVTAAIAGGLDTATVYFPTGIYNIDNTITLANGGDNQSSIRMLFSPGARLRMSVEDTLFNLTGFVTEFIVDGGVFVGQKTYTQDNNSVFFSHTDSSTSGGYVFRNIRVDSIGTVFDLYDVTRIKVEDSQFREANVVVRGGYNSDGLFFSGNTFWRNDTCAYIYGSSSDVGMWDNNIFGYSNYGYIHTGGGGVTIKGGYWENVANLGIIGNGAGGSFRNINIEGVTFQHGGSPVSGWTFYDNDQITITGNKVTGAPDTLYNVQDSTAKVVFINNFGGTVNFDDDMPLVSVASKIINYNINTENFGNSYLTFPAAASAYASPSNSRIGATFVDTVNTDGGAIGRMHLTNRAGSKFLYNFTPKQNNEWFTYKDMVPFVNGFISNYATLDTANGGSQNYSFISRSFPDGGDYFIAVEFIVDESVYTSDSMYVDLFWKADTVAGTVGWGTAYQIMSTTGAADPSGSVTTKYKSATVSSTQNQLNMTTIANVSTFMLAGSICKVFVRRDGDGSSVTDSILKAAKLLAIRVRYGRS